MAPDCFHVSTKGVLPGRRYAGGQGWGGFRVMDPPAPGLPVVARDARACCVTASRHGRNLRESALHGKTKLDGYAIRPDEFTQQNPRP